MTVARVLLVAARTVDKHQERSKHKGRMEWPVKGDCSQWRLYEHVWDPRNTQERSNVSREVKGLRYRQEQESMQEFHLRVQYTFPVHLGSARIVSS